MIGPPVRLLCYFYFLSQVVPLCEIPFPADGFVTLILMTCNWSDPSYTGLF